MTAQRKTKSSKPDYQFWASMPGWTVDEAAALLCDLEPDNISQDRSGEALAKCRMLARRLKRAEEMDLLESPMRPGEFLEWAISNQLGVSEALTACVKSDKQPKDWRRKFFRTRRKLRKLQEQIDPVKPKQLKTFQILIYSMAADKFGLNEKDSHNTVAKVQRTIQLAGLKLDDDTIRKTLQEAKLRIDADRV
jgi:hypothetical protein